MVKSNDSFNYELDNQIYISIDLKVRVSLQVPHPRGHTERTTEGLKREEMKET